MGFGAASFCAFSDFIYVLASEVDGRGRPVAHAVPLTPCYCLEARVTGGITSFRARYSYSNLLLRKDASSGVRSARGSFQNAIFHGILSLYRRVITGMRHDRTLPHNHVKQCVFLCTTQLPLDSHTTLLLVSKSCTGMHMRLSHMYHCQQQKLTAPKPTPRIHTQKLLLGDIAFAAVWVGVFEPLMVLVWGCGWALVIWRYYGIIMIIEPESSAPPYVAWEHFGQLDKVGLETSP